MARVEIQGGQAGASTAPSRIWDQPGVRQLVEWYVSCYMYSTQMQTTTPA